MKKHRFTVDDLWALPRVGSPVPSPGGGEFLVPVLTYSMKTNESTTRIWRIPSNARGAGTGGRGDPAVALTTADESSGQPAWSPDGKRIAFVRKPGKGKKDGGPKYPSVPQLYVMPADGGEPERLTDVPLGVADPRWFPDGRRIAFISHVFIKGLTLEKTARLAKERSEEPVKAYVTEDRVYRYWDHWLTEGKVQHLFSIDPETREITDLTPDSKRWLGLMEISGNYRISPDGKEIAFCAVRTRPPYDPILMGVFTVKVGSGKPRLLTGDHPAGCHRPVYSPDGRWIVYGMQREFDFYADRVRLVAYDRKKRTHTVLTEDWDRSSAGWVFDGPNTIYLTAEADARTAIFRLDLRKAVRNPKKNPPREIARGGTFGPLNPAGGRIFTIQASLKSPPEVVSLRGTQGSLVRHTAFSRPVMSRVQLSEIEEVIFEGAERDPVQMFIVHPPGEKPRRGKKGGRKFPLVHMIHGGPHGNFGDLWQWRWNAQAFAAPGYVVALVNFHGSTSWGQDFAACIHGRWGDQPYRDIMDATDLLIDRGLVDPKRVAVTGGSYGGYLVSWIASQTDRFACIVNHAGVCDLQTQYASDVTQGRQRSMGGEPWDRIEGMDRYSPMRHARGFHSPMLVLHGMRDYRVPYVEGLQVYNVYKAMKLPARLVVYPDENHWILKPRNSRHWYGEVLGWLKRWLKKGRR
jgi:dipeptidyl aminopeptidase/acylaminoacyl peptidase